MANSGLKTLYIDIEAAPAKAYIWDLKTRYVPIDQVAEDGYIMCFAYRWNDDDEVGFFSLWDHGHKTMIKNAWRLLDEADHVVSYYGSGYDIPRLNTEFMVARLGPPQPYHHTDLFREVSKRFKVLSKSMNHMLKLLSLETKLEHKGMALWTGCMSGNEEDQLIMEDYNIQDVAVMLDLYKELYPWLDNVPNEALYIPEGVEVMCRCGSTDLRFKGYKRTKVLSYKQYQCNDCGSWMKARYAADSGKLRRKDVIAW